MRDPERIDPIIEKLRKRWKENPDLRLGQLIVNRLGVEPYFVEDDKAERRLDKDEYE